MKSIVRLVPFTLGSACLIGLLILAVGGLAGWSTPQQFSDGFFIAGLLAAGAGILSVLGGYGLRSDFKVVYSQSAGDMNLLERSRRWVADTAQGDRAFLLFLLTGGFLIVFSILIPRIF